MDIAKVQEELVTAAYDAFVTKLDEVNSLDFGALEDDYPQREDRATIINDHRVRLRERYHDFDTSLKTASDITSSIEDSTERLGYIKTVESMIKFYGDRGIGSRFENAMQSLANAYCSYTNEQTMDYVDNDAAINVEEDSIFGDNGDHMDFGDEDVNSTIREMAGSELSEIRSTHHGTISRHQTSDRRNLGAERRAAIRIANPTSTPFPPLRFPVADPFASHSTLINPKSVKPGKVTPPLFRSRAASANTAAPSLDIVSPLGGPIVGNGTNTAVNNTLASGTNALINQVANVAISAAAQIPTLANSNVNNSAGVQQLATVNTQQVRTPLVNVATNVVRR